MKMSTRVAVTSVGVVVLFVLSVASTSCMMSGNDMSTPIVRPAVNTPAHFVLTSPETDVTSRPIDDKSQCLGPLVDPRDGTHLILVRASGTQGDYEVLPGRYGTGDGELLRIDCTTLTAIGVARR